MSTGRIDQVLAAAVAEGILPPGTVAPSDSQRPWPVIALTALGAWLAAAPLAAFLGLLFEGVLTKGIAPFIIGGALIAGTVRILRAKNVPLFVEQLALPALLAGGAMLAVGLFKSLPDQPAVFLLALVASVCAVFIAHNWLRILLGALACALVIAAMTWNDAQDTAWAGLYLALALWLAGDFAVRSALAQGEVRPAAALGAFSSGWIITLLAGLAVWSGMTFLAGASLADAGGAPARFSVAEQAASLALAAAAAAWIWRRWPSLRTSWSGAAALVLVALAWFMPALGATLLAAAILATAARWRMAMAAGLTAAWIVGAFYYQLALPLAIKAGIMVGAGALLAAIAWFALGFQRNMLTGTSGPAGPRQPVLGIALCALAVLAVANVGIWQKERLIEHGQPIFVELAPVDPRSLMQGDYMALDFTLSRQAVQWLNGRQGERAPVIAKVDERGVATFVRTDDGGALAPGHIRLVLTPYGRGWKIATDAWYFKEGEASRWERAKFGEFRVDASGRALLVGMRGPNLEPL